MTLEFVPICDYCPMREAHQSTEEQMAKARSIAIDVAYNDFIQPSKISEKIEEQGIDADLAQFAKDCLGNIQRRYCIKADRGYMDDSTFGVIPRTEF